MNKPEFIDGLHPALKWKAVRDKRDELINDVQFEYERNARQLRMSGEPTRSPKWMLKLDVYVEALADITNAEINKLTWPIKPN